jgi:hypothetical protein
VGVVGERHHDVGASAEELTMQLTECVGLIQDHLGYVGAGFDVATPLELEDVSFGSQHEAGLQPF